MGNLPAEAPRAVNRIYELLFDDGEERVCKDIPGEACAHVPRNFLMIGTTQVLTKLADELANAKTVLPWLLGAVGASSVWVGLLVPVRESMSMLPQLFIASFVRQQARRKAMWILGALLQGTALLGMVGAALLVRGAAAGAAVLGLLLVFSLARGLCSLASKDVIGKTIPKTRRGRLVGYTAAVSGLLALVVGVALVARLDGDAAPGVFALLLAVSAGLWLLAAGVFATVAESPGATEGGRNAWRAAFKRVAILRTDAAFRRFVTVRALFISTGLAGPYYVLLARETGSGDLLGLFILASGLASALSSAFWGHYADRSSRSVLISAAAIASGLGVLMFICDALGTFQAGYGWLVPVAYFVLAMAHSGVRIGRKTYVLDLAGADRRTDYIAVSNTLIGALLLLSGVLGALTPWLGSAGMLLLLSLFGFGGALLGKRLPEVE